MKKRVRSTREISEIYRSGESRITQERLDFLLPQVLGLIRDSKWLNLRPEYQRRIVWSGKKKSLFIESLLMNIPVPPVFLYEYDLSRYEVIDGQQRLNTIVEFYEDRLVLRGLKAPWSALNGLTYSNCDETIRRGFDRRKISATILLAENAKYESRGEDDIRRQVFERLNTGGQRLNAQELRNCLYSGPFNDLLVELAQEKLFQKIWGIRAEPSVEDSEDEDSGEIEEQEPQENLYRRMKDCEIVLRFFALRDQRDIKGSMRRILDLHMRRLLNVSEPDLDRMRKTFKTRLQLARKIFGSNVFRITKASGSSALSEPLYDAVMVGVDRNWARKVQLIAHSKQIQRKLTSRLAQKKSYELIVGKPNTALAIKRRLDLVDRIFADAGK